MTLGVAAENPARCDLHCHSTHSDGTSTPTELIERAHQLGLAGLSLTDHDTVAGLDEAATVADRLDMEFLPGIEISAGCGDGEVHILGYGFDPLHRALATGLEQQRRAREDRIPRIVEKLRELGIEIETEEVMAVAGSGAPGRPHVAHVLVEKGVCRSVQQVFERYLHDKGPANVPKEMLSAKAAIELLHGAGGLAVLAHPLAKPVLRTGGLNALVSELTRDGIDGLEVQHPSHTPKDSKRVGKLGRKYELLLTGGSDYHGGNSPGVELGSGRGGIHVPLSTLHALLEKRC